jgi:hypothetical protein
MYYRKKDKRREFVGSLEESMSTHGFLSRLFHSNQKKVNFGCLYVITIRMIKHDSGNISD